MTSPLRSFATVDFGTNSFLVITCCEVLDGSDFTLSKIRDFSLEREIYFRDMGSITLKFTLKLK